MAATNEDAKLRLSRDEQKKDTSRCSSILRCLWPSSNAARPSNDLEAGLIANTSTSNGTTPVSEKNTELLSNRCIITLEAVGGFIFTVCAGVAAKKADIQSINHIDADHINSTHGQEAVGFSALTAMCFILAIVGLYKRYHPAETQAQITNGNAAGQPTPPVDVDEALYSARSKK